MKKDFYRLYHWNGGEWQDAKGGGWESGPRGKEAESRPVTQRRKEGEGKRKARDVYGAGSAQAYKEEALLLFCRTGAMHGKCSSV